MARFLLKPIGGHDLVQPASIAWRNVAERHPRVRNNLKQAINASEESERVYFHEGDIWWARVGVNVGYEIDGKHKQFARPVIVLKKNHPHSKSSP